jgi:tetratricopeptide (TPR) repeat protein
MLEQAVRLEPESSELHLWLGRAYGRRAETSSFLTAPGLASKAREQFERAVALNPANKEAVGDLFDYYLEAPGFLGGGADKARALAEKYKDTDPAEYQYRLAQLALKRRDVKAAEEYLRKALELEPRKPGRHIDLAAFLSRQKRYDESDAVFQKAAEVTPGSPRLLFERARTYIEARRNLAEARELLARYLKAPLAPDDPPRAEAEKLLRRAQSS